LGFAWRSLGLAKEGCGLFIVASGLDGAIGCGGAGAGEWLGGEFGGEGEEVSLEAGGVCAPLADALVVGEEAGYGVLGLQSAEGLGEGAVVDGGEVEGGVELAGLHVGDEGNGVGGAGVADAVAPDGVKVGGDGAGEGGEVVVEIAVEVGFEDEVFRFEVLLAGGHADVDDVVEYDEAGEMVPGARANGLASPVGSLAR